MKNLGYDNERYTAYVSAKLCEYMKLTALIKATTKDKETVRLIEKFHGKK